MTTSSPPSSPTFGRDVEVDVAVAIERFPFVQSVHALSPPKLAHGSSVAARDGADDSYCFAIVLEPYTIRSLVEVHYAVLRATGGRYELTGRVLYVDASMPLSLPSHAKRIVVDPTARAFAQRRIDERLKSAPHEAEDDPIIRDRINAAFRAIAEQAARDSADTHPVTRDPYRDESSAEEKDPALQRIKRAISASLGNVIVLEIVRDPFPSVRRERVMLLDQEDPYTERRLREELGPLGIDLVCVHDGWNAIDKLQLSDAPPHESPASTRLPFDLVICALMLGDFPGTKIHRLVTKNRPALAPRIYLLASAAAVADAPPSSASGRILARPLTSETIRNLLDRHRTPI